MAAHPDAHAMLRRLRAYWTLTLHFKDQGDTRVVESGYVVDPASNRVTLGFDGAPPDEAILFIPDDGWEALEVLAELTPLQPPDSAAADRFRAAHPPAGRVPLVSARLLTAKHQGTVAGEEELGLSFSWLDQERDLRRMLNQRREALRLAAGEALKRPIDECVALSVDPDGVLIRTRHGPARLAFPARCPTLDAARSAVEDLLKEARS